MRPTPCAATTVSVRATILAATTWFACGVVLLGLTPLPWYAPEAGWAPAFWLLVAPGLILLGRLACARGQPHPRATAGSAQHAPMLVSHRRRSGAARRTRSSRHAGAHPATRRAG